MVWSLQGLRVLSPTLGGSELGPRRFVVVGHGGPGWDRGLTPGPRPESPLPGLTRRPCPFFLPPPVVVPLVVLPDPLGVRLR